MIRTRSRTLSTLACVAVLAAALAGCAGTSSGAATSAPPSQTTAPEPEPTEEPTPTIEPATLPADCESLGTDSVRQEAVGDLTLQGDGTGFVRPAPEGATLELGCDWIVGDTTGILLLISTAPADAVADASATLPDQGYECGVSDDFGATFCQLMGEGADTEEMIVARDDVWIYMSTSNRNGRAFLSDIASQIWG